MSTPRTDTTIEARLSDIQEWIHHLDLHVTEHDLSHAGKALRGAWPQVKKHFIEQEAALKRLITEYGNLRKNDLAKLAALQARIEEAGKEVPPEPSRDVHWCHTSSEWMKYTDTLRQQYAALLAKSKGDAPEAKDSGVTVPEELLQKWYGTMRTKAPRGMHTDQCCNEMFLILQRRTV